MIKAIDIYTMSDDMVPKTGKKKKPAVEDDTDAQKAVFDLDKKKKPKTEVTEVTEVIEGEEEHIFDLDKKKEKPIKMPNGKKRRIEYFQKYEPRTYTTEEKLEKIKGYTKYDNPDDWNDIPVGSHIRLIKRNGKFLVGGFVKSKYKAKDAGFRFTIENRKYNRNPKAGYHTFSIALNDIKRIFVKEDLGLGYKKLVEQSAAQNKKFEVIARALKNYSKQLKQQERVIILQHEKIKELETTLEDVQSRLTKTETAVVQTTKYLKGKPRL